MRNILFIFVAIQIAVLGFAVLNPKEETHSDKLSAVSPIQVPQGGTGSSTLSGILVGNGVDAIKTLLIGTGLSFDGTTISGSGSMTALPEGNLYVGNASNVAVATSSLTITGTGQLKFASFSSSPLIYADSDTNTGLVLSAPDTLSLMSGGTSRLTVNSMGYVGIGTTSPTYPLDVYGNARFDGNVSMSNLTVSGTATTTALCFASGQCMTQPSLSGSNVTMYHWNGASDTAGYEMFRTFPDNAVENDESCSATAGYCATPIDSYISTTTDLSVTSISAGTWNFHYWTYVSSVAGVSKLQADVYKRTALGVETLLFTATSSEINTTSIAETDFSSAQGAFDFDPTDRLVVKVLGYTTSAGAIDIHFIYGGQTNYSHVETPIMQADFDYAVKSATQTITGEWTHTATTTLATTTISIASTTRLSVSGNTWLTGLLTAGNASTTNLSASAIADINTLRVSGIATLPNASTTHMSVTGSSFLGTVRTGTWNGSTIGIAYGGTNATAYSPHTVIGFNGTSFISTTTIYAQAFNATNTSATSTMTRLAVGTAFNLLGDYITNVATWFSTKLNAVTAFVASSASTWDFGSAGSVEIPNGATPTVDAVGEIALKTSPANALVVATSTASTSPAIIPLALPIRFTVISSSTATTTVGYPTLDYNERVLVGVCKGAQTANIRVGDGTNWSNLVNIGTGTTTITFTSETTFNKGGEMLTFEVGPTATNEKAIWCSFRRAYEL